MSSYTYNPTVDKYTPVLSKSETKTQFPLAETSVLRKSLTIWIKSVQGHTEINCSEKIIIFSQAIVRNKLLTRPVTVIKDILLVNW